MEAKESAFFEQQSLFSEGFCAREEI